MEVLNQQAVEHWISTHPGITVVLTEIIARSVKNQSREGVTLVSKLFTVLIQKDDIWYVAKCLENAVASQGKTMDEAMENLREALTLYYEDEPFPKFPQTFVTTLEVVL